MKSFFLVFGVIFLSGAIVFIWISQGSVTPTVDSISEQIFPKSETYAISSGILTPISESAETLGLPLREGDIILYAKLSDAPKVRDRSGIQEISLGKGIYILGLSDVFHEYRVVSDSFSIQHLSNGVYFVDTRSEEFRLFSLTALLRVTLGSIGKPVTDLNIFPSGILSYNPAELNDNLNRADAFRVGQLTQFTLWDVRSEQDIQKVFGAQFQTPNSLYLEYVRFAIRRQEEVQKLYGLFRGTSDGNLSLLEEYGLFFVNPEKKKILLQNSLLSLLQRALLIDSGACDSLCQKKGISASQIPAKISERIRQLEEMNPSHADQARLMVRKYLSVASIARTEHSQEYYSQGGSMVVRVYQGVFGDKAITSKAAYRLLTEMYAQYFFGQLDRQSLEKNLTNYVTFLVQSKAMGEGEFLGFTYFLKEFLASGNNSDEIPLKLFAQIIAIAQNYTATLKNEKDQFSILGVFFYTFTSIANRTENGLRNAFFDGSLENLTLKSQYLSGEDTPKIPPGVLDALTFLLDTNSRFMTQYKSLYYANLGEAQWGSVDSYIRAESAFGGVSKILAIFTGYAEYRTQVTLGQWSRNATGLVVQDTVLSLDSLRTYLSGFNGVDESSIVVSNPFEQDGFYEVSANIYGRTFRFRLIPRGHTLQNIIYTDLDGQEKREYEKISVSLDERDAYLRERGSGVQSAEQRARYDIKNFFKFTFFPDSQGSTSPTLVDTGAGEHGALSPTMQVWAQQELIEKDFAIVADIFPISIKNIAVQVQGGAYDIALSGVVSRISSPGRSFKIESKSQYIFQDTVHAFQNWSFRVRTEEGSGYEFEGQEVRILPERIDTKDEFRQRYLSIWPLLERALRYYSPGTTGITLDLMDNSVIISGTRYSQ